MHNGCPIMGLSNKDDHPKTKALTNPNVPVSNQNDITLSAPSIYQDAQIVEPGHFLR